MVEHVIQQTLLPGPGKLPVFFDALLNLLTVTPVYSQTSLSGYRLSG